MMLVVRLYSSCISAVWGTDFYFSELLIHERFRSDLNCCPRYCWSGLERAGPLSLATVAPSGMIDGLIVVAQANNARLSRSAVVLAKVPR